MYVKPINIYDILFHSVSSVEKQFFDNDVGSLRTPLSQQQKF